MSYIIVTCFSRFNTFELGKNREQSFLTYSNVRHISRSEAGEYLPR